MKFYSGFCFQSEDKLFTHILKQNDFSVAGFSYGAIKALQHCLQTKDRIDKLILISPAYFMDKDEKFKKMQLLYFKKNPQIYTQKFLKNVTHASDAKVGAFFKQGNTKQLQELLFFNWEMIKELDKKIDIQVHLGAKDKVIDADKAKDFFSAYAQCFFYKNYGHLVI